MEIFGHRIAYRQIAVAGFVAGVSVALGTSAGGVLFRMIYVAVKVAL